MSLLKFIIEPFSCLRMIIKSIPLKSSIVNCLLLFKYSRNSIMSLNTSKATALMHKFFSLILANDNKMSISYKIWYTSIT